MNRHRHAPHFLITILSIVLLVTGCGGDSEPKSQPAKVGGQPGDLAPDFALVNLAGDTVKLSDLRGKIVLVDFWATWCGPCKMAMPHLQEIHNEYQDEGVTIVAISVDQKGLSVVRPFIEKNGYTFEVVMTDRMIEQKFGPIPGIPTTFIIDPQGHVYKKWVGYQSKTVFENAIKEIKAGVAS